MIPHQWFLLHDHGLGSDPHLYFALVQVELTLQGVAVKIARTDVDAKAFVDEFVAVLRERVSRATSNS